MSLLESALPSAPIAMDSEKPRPYLATLPYKTPSHYPQEPLPDADTLEYYLKLAPETLFYIFYYNEVSQTFYTVYFTTH